MNDNHDYCVIMAGGIGSRFWPQSHMEAPKQFIDFFGTGRTLLQQTYNRFARIVPANHIYISTHLDYQQLVREQLPELDPQHIIREPAHKRTAPSMALTAYHIRELDSEARIVMAPSDQLILNEEQFRRNMLDALEYVGTHPHLLTVGIQPTHAETRYGYIQADSSVTEPTKNAICKVKTFTEKPQPEFARLFVESNEFFWNTGLFVWSAATIIDTMHQLLPDMTARFDRIFTEHTTRDERRADLYRCYESFPSISVDYAVIEKASNMYMLIGDFGWSDIGRWADVWSGSQKDDDGNAVIRGNADFYNSHNNIVALPQDRLVIVKDLDGYLVNATDKVIVICPKDEDEAIKRFRRDTRMKYGDEYL